MLYRLDALRRDPRLAVVLEGLANRISAPTMRALNAQVKLGGRDETQVAATFLHLQAPAADDWLTRLQRRTVEHLALVGLSMALAIALGIPLGVLAAHWAGAKQAVLAVTSILQTVPSLAMLVFLISRARHRRQACHRGALLLQSAADRAQYHCGSRRY